MAGSQYRHANSIYFTKYNNKKQLQIRRYSETIKIQCVASRRKLNQTMTQLPPYNRLIKPRKTVFISYFFSAFSF